MMVKRWTLGIFLSLLLLTISMPTLAENAGQPLPWLNNTPSTKSIALGDSQVVVTSGAAAVILNPANLSWQNTNYLSMTHTEPLVEVNQDYVGLSYQLGGGWSVGFGYQKLDINELYEYNEQGQVTKYIDQLEQAFNVAASYRVHPKMSLGGTARLITQHLGDDSSVGYALNLGMMWQARKNLLIGATLANPVGKIVWDTGYTETLQLLGRVGAAYYWPEYDLTVIGEYLYDQADTPFHIGIEKVYKEALRFRAGMDGKTPTMGIGVKMARLSVDYAFVLDEAFGKRQYLSLNWQY